MTIRSALHAAAALIVAASLLSACSGQPTGAMPTNSATNTGENVSSEHWVVVMFGGSEDVMPIGWMDSLLPTELKAIEALESSGLGYIDGNEIGDNSYELYFVGEDREAVWAVLAPIFAEAPITWTQVELRTQLEDPNPIVLLP